MKQFMKPVKLLHLVLNPVGQGSSTFSSSSTSQRSNEIQNTKPEDRSIVLVGTPRRQLMTSNTLLKDCGRSAPSNPCKTRGAGSRRPDKDPCSGRGETGLKSLKNKICVITGGAEGIGYEMADAYLKRKAKVVILLDINELKGKEAQGALNCKYGNDKAMFCKCDVVTDLERTSENIFAAYKRVDVLVNNAGILDQIPAKTLIDINVAALIEWSLKFWNHMRKDKGGKGGTIVNLSSIYGYRLDPFHPIYQSSKFAVMGFTKALGHEYTFKKTGVRIMAICPGFTHSKMTSKARPWDDMYGEDLPKFLKAQAWQNLDAVGWCAVRSFEKGDSGSAWLTEGNKMGEIILKHMVCGCESKKK